MIFPADGADPASVAADQILRALMVASVLRAAHPTPAAEGLAEAARDMAEALTSRPGGALLASLQRYDAQCRRKLAQHDPLDVVATAHLCAMGCIPHDDPRHQAMLDHLFTTPDVPQRMQRVLAGGD